MTKKSTARKRSPVARKATTTGPARQPLLDVDIGAQVAEASRRQALAKELERVGQRLHRRLRHVIDAWQRFEQRLPNVAAQPEKAPRQALEHSKLADARLALCTTVREAKFDPGMEQLLGSVSGDVDNNHKLAVHLYQLGWSNDRRALLGLLKELERLPRQRDHFDASAPSQDGVWGYVKHFFGYLVRWPDLSPEPHPWHPDYLESVRLHAELSGQSGQQDPVNGKTSVGSLANADAPHQDADPLAIRKDCTVRSDGGRECEAARDTERREHVGPQSPTPPAEIPELQNASTEKLKKYARGPLANKAKVDQRNKLIDEAKAIGIEREEALYEYVKKYDAPLLFADRKGKRLISVGSMMKIYERRKMG